MKIFSCYYVGCITEVLVETARYAMLWRFNVLLCDCTKTAA